MLKHVLVPLDGSPLAERALDAARRVVAADGKVTLMTAVQSAEAPFFASPSADFIEDVAFHAEVTASEMSEERAYLAHQATNLQLYGLQTAIEIVVGEPATAIIERATVLGVEAIVMSPHGHSGLHDLLFGSTIITVVTKAPCLVVVVPRREQIHVEDEEPAVVPDTPMPDTGLTPAT